jgi:RHS repeat-associated protein
VSTSSARPDDLDAFARDSRAADDELRGHDQRLRAAYLEFQAGTRWGHVDAASLLAAFGTYVRLNDADARWVAQIAAAFRAAGGDGGLARLPDAAIDASLRAAGLTGGRAAVTFDSPVAYGFPATTGYADDPVNTASGNFLIAETELPVGALAAGLTVRRVYNSRSDRAGAFGPGWSSWADARLHARADGAHYAGPDGQRAVFPRQGAGYGRVLGVAATVSPTATGLALHWFDGRVWEFDDTGRPVRAGDVAFTYADGRLHRTTHPGGRWAEFTWTGDRITGAAAADGRRVAYAYNDGVLTAAGDRRYEVDARARVTAVIDADGVTEAANTYDDAGRVRAQVSRFGRRTRYAYLPGGVTVTAGEADDSPANTYLHDAHGRLLAVVDGHGNRLTRTYDEHGNPVTVTDRNGAVTTVAWDDRGRPVRRTEPGGATFTWTYDTAGRVVEAAASTGATVRYRYEGAERTPVEVVDAEGGVTRLEVRDGLVHRVTDPDGIAVTCAFDADGAIRSMTDAFGATATIERDAAGRVVATVTPLGRRTTFGHDDHGRLTERRDPAGGVWRYEYSAAGRVTAVVDPAGARRETRYGDHGAVEATVDPLGHTTTRRYDEIGNLARLVAPDGAKWDFTYDALSRLTATTDPAGATWVREYDAGGNLVGTVDPVGTHRTAGVDSAGRVTALGDGLTGSTFAYDDLGRPVAHVRPDGTGARAGYDRCGRRTTVEDPSGGVTRIAYTPAGRVRSTTSPGGRTTTFAYDAAGRLAARVDGAGRRWEFRYDADGAPVARVRPSGAVEAFHYDAAGRLVARELPGGRVTRFAHDPAGRVVAVTDPAGGVRRYRYDPAGRLTEAVDPLGGVTRYAYHPRGWLTAITDPLGATTTRAYDEAGRPVRETDPLGRVTTFRYDAAGRLTGRVDGAGREVRWAYDPSGRVRSITAGADAAVTVTRDALGRPVAVDEPGSYRHRLRWDAAGRLVERGRDDLVLRNRYGSDGERLAFVLPDGSETTFTYDGAGLLSGVRRPGSDPVTYRRDADGRIVADGLGGRWEYTDGLLTAYSSTRLRRDAAGRIVAAGDREFRYDAAGQLVAAGGRTFAYDAAGRLVRDGDVQLGYDAAGQLVAAGGRTFAYDGSGRRVREGRSRTYSWDAFGRLAGVGDVTVTVDAFGELAQVDGRAVLWDRGDPCWVGDGPWAPAVSPDWQGTPGGGRDAWGAPARSEPVPGPGFRGEVEFAGLTWLRHRVYDPATRGFLSRDPLPAVPGTAWSGNPYHYAGNDPVNRADPAGLRPVTDAELRAYRDELGRNAWAKTTDWVGENWEYLAAGAMIVGGVALMFTGVGGPAGVALMAASGGLIAGGASAGIQKFTTGEVDWGQVAKDGLVGAAAGGLGAGAAAVATSSARLAATNPLARELLINGAESVVGGGVERGLTGGDIFNPRALATDLLTGGAAPAPGAGLGRDLPEPPEFIFRGGGPTDANLTPRPGTDDTGLSTYDDPHLAMGERGNKAQIIRTELLGADLVAVPDAPPPGHVSIRPSDMSTMPEWQATRGDVMSGGAAHPYTGQVREAIVGEVRRDREGNLRWPEWWDQ